jgi:hypothetical protein
VSINNRLKLNADKTRAVWMGTRQQLAKVDIKDLHLRTAIVAWSSTVSNLGVVIDCHMNMSEHIASFMFVPVTAAVNNPAVSHI